MMQKSPYLSQKMFFLLMFFLFLGIVGTVHAATDEYTVLLIQSNNANSDTTFSDASLKNQSITLHGNPFHSTAEAKFGSSSIYLDGSSYLEVPNSDDFYFADDVFTIDFWTKSSFYQPSEGFGCFFSSDGSVAQGAYNHHNLYVSSTDLSFRMYSGNTAYSVSPEIEVLDGEWHHIAFMRDTDQYLKLYIDGILIGNTYIGDVTLNDVTDDANIYIGTTNQDDGTSIPHYYKGYIDEFRVSKGIARWSENFTPPSAVPIPSSFLLLSVGILGLLLVTHNRNMFSGSRRLG